MGFDEPFEPKPKPKLLKPTPKFYEDKYKKLLEKEREKEEEREKEKRIPLSTTFTMEKTPIGNVVLCYNAKEERFEYYSDATIPYSYLDVVCKRFVIQNKCTHLFIDMEKEIKEVNLHKNQEKNNDKKSVFAKFKSYNDSTISKSAVPSKKNNMLNPVLNDIQQKSTIMLKDKTNKYVHLGRFSAFPMIQKIDRKTIVKRYATNYSDFKKIKNYSNIDIDAELIQEK
jgi:hypothetical protein